LLCFSDNAADIMYPSPDGPAPLSGGSSMTVQVVGDPEPGCCVNVVDQASAGKPDGGESPAGVLFVFAPKRRPGPPDPWQSGH
jgi:hypothetical protein